MSKYPSESSEIPEPVRNIMFHPGCYAADLEQQAFQSHQTFDQMNGAMSFEPYNSRHIASDSMSGYSQVHHNVYYDASHAPPFQMNSQIQPAFYHNLYAPPPVPHHLDAQSAATGTMTGTSGFINSQPIYNLNPTNAQRGRGMRGKRGGRRTYANQEYSRGGPSHSDHYYSKQENGHVYDQPPLPYQGAHGSDSQHNIQYYGKKFQNHSHEDQNRQHSYDFKMAKHGGKHQIRGKSYRNYRSELHQDRSEKRSEHLDMENTDQNQPDDSTHKVESNEPGKRREKPSASNTKSYQDSSDVPIRNPHSLSKRTTQESNSSGLFKNSPSSLNYKDDNKNQRNSTSSAKWRGSKQVSKHQVKENDESQRGSLTEQLTSNKYECMVCCDNIYVDDPVWSCLNCYHVFHLPCIRKWAQSSVSQESRSWRCPGCQNESTYIPSQYRCFCGNRKNPKYVRGETPHSCGEACRRKRASGCKHPCTLLCHPGPCPPCSSTVFVKCDCGKVRKNVRCSANNQFKCDAVCNKSLNCSIHNCELMCHAGPCPPCTDSKSQTCYCSKSKRTVICGTDEFLMISYTCERPCGKQLSCGNHLCEEPCHPGDCAPCELTPVNLKICCCGRTTLESLTSKIPERSSCLDPVPTCDKTCSKPLACGPPRVAVVKIPEKIDKLKHEQYRGKRELIINKRNQGRSLQCHSVTAERAVMSISKGAVQAMSLGAVQPHMCERKCHNGDCGPCKKETTLKCECGAHEKKMACEVAVTFNENNPFKCQRRCGKKKTCGRHKCAESCCVMDIHICEIVCGRKLSCGVHKCEELCHKGNCKRCLQASFDELTCFCGAQVLEPPIACGTKRPECHLPCTRQHDCDHEVRHHCHVEEKCPPCTELTEKLCMGGHMTRKNIPCYLTEVSCGYPCQKKLPCGLHSCQRKCHKGDCLEEGVSCSQSCTKKREACGHPCGAPCHSGDCPDTACKAEITITCPCGNRSSKAQCLAGGKDVQSNIAQFQRLSVQSLVGASGQDIDMAQFTQLKKANRRMECDTNCAIIERNKRLALALEIKDPDMSAKLGTPSFSEFLVEFARKNPKMAGTVEKSLSELVQSVKQTGAATKSHAFPPMNRDQRRFVHELAECFGCQTQSFDYEPNKNVVATAARDKCWLPNISLMSHALQGQQSKKPSTRMGVSFTAMKTDKEEDVGKSSASGGASSSINRRAWETSGPRPSTAAAAVARPATLTPSSTANPKPAAAPVIDYFDFEG